MVKLNLLDSKKIKKAKKQMDYELVQLYVVKWLRNSTQLYRFRNH